MAVATDEQHNKSETAVVPSLRCSHFKVKCVETHLSIEAQIQRAGNCYLDSRRWLGLRGIMSLFVLILFRVFLHQLAAAWILIIQDLLKCFYRHFHLFYTFSFVDSLSKDTVAY